MKQLHISGVYNLDLWDEGVIDQKTTDQSWIYAALHPLRQKAKKTLSMKQKNYRLSTAYFHYFDLLEKSRACLEAVEQGKVTTVPDIKEASGWKDFARLAEKHGVVPLSAMQDEHLGHTGTALYVVNNRLKLGAKELEHGENTVDGVMEDIKDILNNKLSVPPTAFDIAYMNTDDEIVTLQGVTPHAFMKDICRFDPSQYEEIPYHDALEEFVVRQLQAGEQVVILADTRHQSNQLLGILDTEFIDSTDLFGKNLAMTREEKIDYGLTRGTAYLSLDGVQLENGIPVRFKAQDSHGAATGADGHYTMSRAWFHEYVLSAVIKKEISEG